MSAPRAQVGGASWDEAGWQFEEWGDQLVADLQYAARATLWDSLDTADRNRETGSWPYQVTMRRSLITHKRKQWAKVANLQWRDDS